MRRIVPNPPVPLRLGLLSTSAALVCIVGMAGPGVAYAEADLPAADGETPKPPRPGWGVTGYPILFYSPETKLALGGGLVLYDNHPPLRPDVTELELFGTQMKQLELNVAQTTFFRGNDLQLAVSLKLDRSPRSQFFGVGADTREVDKEEYLAKRGALDGAFLFEVWKNIYLGPAFNVSLAQATKLASGGRLDRGVVRGGREDVSVGAGARLSWDSTDQTFFPTRGIRFDMSGLFYRSELGSFEDFFQLELDHRRYYRLLDGHVLAFQAVATLSRGDVPWQKLPRLGGMSMLRGYYEGRYRDRHLLAAQAEYRFPLVWRVSGAVFASAGEVARTLRAVSADTLRASAGGGPRLLLDEDEHINVRLDIAATAEGGADFYISLMEAF